MKEAVELQDHAKDLLDKDTYVILNKCLQAELSQWEPSSEDTLAKKIKESMETREKELKNFMQTKFNHILEFNEVLKVSPDDHVKELVLQWEQMNNKE